MIRRAIVLTLGDIGLTANARKFSLENEILFKLVSRDIVEKKPGLAKRFIKALIEGIQVY